MGKTRREESRGGRREKSIWEGESTASVSEIYRLRHATKCRKNILKNYSCAFVISELENKNVLSINSTQPTVK